ncbi:MAG: fimbria/pilus outer membrane usher protein [Pseudobdellovibrionaceae bacterium]
MLFDSIASATSSVLYDIGQVNVSSGVNVRSGETLLAKVIGLLRAQDTFAVAGKNDWFVILDGPFKGGYVRKEFVKLTGERLPLGKTLTDTVLVRGTPSKAGAIKGKLASGEIFATQKKDEDWLEIKDGPFRGKFITASFVTDVDAVANTETQPTPQSTLRQPAEPGPTPLATPVSVEPTPPAPSFLKGVVSSKNAVNIRSEPTTKSPSKGLASPGIILDLEPVGSDWYKIQSGLNSGNYIAAPFVKILSGQDLATSKTSPSPPNFAAPTANWDSGTEQRFQNQIDKIFKKKNKSSLQNEIVTPVFFENRSMPLGQIDIRLGADESLTLDAPAFFKFLRLLLISSWFDQPNIAAINPETVKDSKDFAAKRWLSLQSFENMGIKVTFDKQRLDIIVSVPPELRAPGVASLLKGSQTSEEAALAEKPAGFSTFFNIYASEVFDTRYHEYSDRRMPLRAQLENGTNIGGIVFEAYGRYLEDRTGNSGDSSGFARGDVRAVKDFPDKTIRTSVGDLVYPTQSFQTYRQLGGISVTSNFSMARSKLTYPTGNYEIFLQRNSKVYVWVNDQLQQVLDLPAGRHSIRDFPFVNGTNDLRLEIVDDVGREETLRYSYFSSTELLRPELHQYNYTVGSPSTDIGNTRTYDKSNTTVSAFHRYGLAEDLTVGANLQADKSQGVLGLEALWSTSVGFIKLEPAISVLNSETAGAFRAGYSYSDYKGVMKTQRTYRFDVLLAGTSFNQLSPSADTLPATQSTRKIFEFAGGYSQGLSRSLSANFTGSYRLFDSLTGKQEAYVLGAGANKKWDNGLSLSASISHTKFQAGNEELNLFTFFLWSFPKEKQIITAIQNSSDQSTRLDWSYNPSNGADSSSYGATLRENQKERGYSAQILHEGNRIRSTLSHEVIFSKQPDPTATGDEVNKKPTNHVTNISLASSLAYAGGHLAIGRPVTDSFAIIAPVKNLNGKRLDINPLGEDSYTVKSDLLGPALVPEISSYNFTELVVSGRKLPPELSLPKDHFSVYPGYKSGYVFEVGTDATVYITAEILNPEGHPLPLAAGRAIYLDDLNHPEVTIFTNKKGILNSEGFKPGRYRLEIASDTFEPIEITIPESAIDRHDLGILKVKAK